MNLDEIQAIFFQECEEGLATLEASFAAVKLGDHAPDTINTIFRAVHSIKGGAGAFGFERLQAFTHDYETLLDQVRSGAVAITGELLVTTLLAFDMLADHVTAARDNGTAPSDTALRDRLLAAAVAAPAAVPVVPVAAGAPTNAFDDFDDLFAMCADAPPAEASVADRWRVTVIPGPDGLDHAGEPLLLLRELTMLGGEVVAVDASRLPLLDALIAERSYLGWTITLPSNVAEEDIRSVFDFMGEGEVTIARDPAEVPVSEVSAQPMSLPTLDVVNFSSAVAETAATALPPATASAPVPEAASLPVPATTTPPPQAQTIRVDLDKLDRLVNLVGELVITQAMLSQRLSDHAMAGISEMSDLEHLTRELQESVMAIRAQPMRTVFSRVPRIIRELEADTGKRVRLEIEGEMTEVDKTVVERIGEPLTHLIRNAVDHGLELPGDRLTAGKQEEGVVRLSAAHQSGRIVITVADDGRGIDRERVRAKAVERGIVAPDAALTDEDIDNLIFAPGFSTASTVSNISGRGVGMDVVRQNVQALGGRIGIQSQPGRGSSFALSLPLTLAVLDGMIVTVGDQTFVVPLGHIVESLRPDQDSVKIIGPNAALLDVRGSYVPVHRVAEQLRIVGAQDDPTQAVLIVVESDHGQAVLMVDAIQDQRQVVVKSLEANYRAIPGVAGATILGDGRVALILDVDALISRWRRDPRLPGGLPSGVTALAA
jgi:two-component system chemotaxis sensor kinase CheA